MSRCFFTSVQSASDGAQSDLDSATRSFVWSWSCSCVKVRGFRTLLLRRVGVFCAVSIDRDASLNHACRCLLHTIHMTPPRFALRSCPVQARGLYCRVLTFEASPGGLYRGCEMSESSPACVNASRPDTFDSEPRKSLAFPFVGIFELFELNRMATIQNSRLN